MASSERKREAKQSPGKEAAPRHGRTRFAQAPVAVAPSPKTHHKTAAPEPAAVHAAAPPGGDTWSESASFIVYVERKVNNGVEECRTVARRRTAVHHMETGESQSWPGVALDECARWMHEHLVQAAAASAGTSVVEERASGGTARFGEAPHAIDGVWLAQGSGRAKEALLTNGHGRATWVDSRQPWRLDFTLGEPRISDRPISARVRVDAVNRISGKRVEVGSAEVLPRAPAAWGAVVRVPAGQLQVGSYALECRIEADAGVLGRIRLPLLQACASVLPPERSASESDMYAPHKR